MSATGAGVTCHSIHLPSAKSDERPGDVQERQRPVQREGHTAQSGTSPSATLGRSPEHTGTGWGHVTGTTGIGGRN